MCFAQAGGERPGKFETRGGADLVLLVLERGEPESPAGAPHPPGSASIAAVELPRKRAFRMGFTGFVHDITPEAVVASRAFVRENADILAHHISFRLKAEQIDALGAGQSAHISHCGHRF